MGDLSPHFDTSEFWDRRESRSWNTRAARRHWSNLKRLSTVLELLRAIDRRPLPIVSGVRSERTNRLVGGAPNSLHIVGSAADIPSGRYTVAQAVAAGASGIGHCRGWVVHVDVRGASSPVIFRDC